MKLSESDGFIAGLLIAAILAGMVWVALRGV